MAFYSDALKGRKGEKEMGIQNSVWAQSPEERECRRESENSGPAMVKRHIYPLTNRNVIHKMRFVKYFVKKFF